MWEIKRADRPVYSYTVVSKGTTTNGILPVPAKAVLTHILPYCPTASQQQAYNALLLSRRQSTSILCNSDKLLHQNRFKTVNIVSWEVTPSSLLGIY
jgi:hypothetical protein